MHSFPCGFIEAILLALIFFIFLFVFPWFLVVARGCCLPACGAGLWSSCRPTAECDFSCEADWSVASDALRLVCSHIISKTAILARIIFLQPRLQLDSMSRVWSERTKVDVALFRSVELEDSMRWKVVR